MKNYGGFYCLLGASASGKTTIARILESRYDLSMVRSYTTREPRTKSGVCVDDSHIFVTDTEFSTLPLLESAVYCGHCYGTTKELLDSCKIHVLEPKGYDSLLSGYGRERTMFKIYIRADEKTRERRMLMRGDFPADVERRLDYDREAFRGMEKDAALVIDNNLDANINFLADEIYRFISRWDACLQSTEKEVDNMQLFNV